MMLNAQENYLNNKLMCEGYVLQRRVHYSGSAQDVCWSCRGMGLQGR